jgi:hypothetical protein
MSRDEIAGPLDILTGDRPDDELVLLHGLFESEVGQPFDLQPIQELLNQARAGGEARSDCRV